VHYLIETFHTHAVNTKELSLFPLGDNMGSSHQQSQHIIELASYLLALLAQDAQQ